jgi:hypothetical protein
MFGRGEAIGGAAGHRAVHDLVGGRLDAAEHPVGREAVRGARPRGSSRDVNANVSVNENLEPPRAGSAAP